MNVYRNILLEKKKTGKNFAVHMLLFNSKMNIIRIVIVLKLSLLSRQCMSFAELGVTFRSGNTFNNKKSILFPGRKKS